MIVCHMTSAHPRHDLRILKKECVSIANAGYETYLIVNDALEDEKFNGVQIISTGFVPRNRFERLLLSTQKVYNKALATNADVYHFHDPELLGVANKLRRRGKIVIFDAHEDTEMQIMDKEWIPIFARKIISILYSLYSKGIIKKLYGVVTVTPHIVEKMARVNKNTLLVTNYPIIQETVENTVKNENGCKYVFFAGGIAKQWCHLEIAEAISKLNDVKYIFAGRPESDEYLQKLCACKNVKYLGVISHEEVMEYYTQSNLGIAILNSTQVGDEGTLGNTKLFEIMQMGKPLVCSDQKLWKKIVEEQECGICVKNDDISAMASAIDYLISNPDIANRMGSNGKRAVGELYNWKTQERVLLKMYSEIRV